MDRDIEQEGAGGGTALALWLCSCCLLAAVCSLALPSTGAKAGPAPWKAAINALSETRLRLVAPLAFFIGLEQGFLYAHLMQVCTLYFVFKLNFIAALKRLSAVVRGLRVRIGAIVEGISGSGLIEGSSCMHSQHALSTWEETLSRR